MHLMQSGNSKEIYPAWLSIFVCTILSFISIMANNQRLIYDNLLLRVLPIKVLVVQFSRGEHFTNLQYPFISMLGNLLKI